MQKRIADFCRSKVNFLHSNFLKVIGIIGTITLSAACKTIPENVSTEDHLINLMNNQQYDEVIRTIDQMSIEDKSKSENLVLRGEALYGKAGFDMVSLTKVVKLAMDFNGIENSLVRLLKSENPTKPGTTSEISKVQVNIVKSFVSFASYMKVIDFVPQINDSTRPLLMESLITLQRVNDKNSSLFRKARTQSLLIHTVVFISSLKKSVNSLEGNGEGFDPICSIDPKVFSNELPWMTEHLNGALDDAEIVKKILDGDKFKPGRLEKIRQKLKEIQDDPVNFNPSAVSVSLDSYKSYVCN
jgi:hypothetical protein